jgi:hypothetical protein
MELLGLFEHVNGAVHVILFLINPAKVEGGLDVIVVSGGGEELFLCLLEEVEVVVALPQRRLPPWVLVVIELRRHHCQLQALLEVMLHVEEVLEDQS